jgi:hypothetical protein
MANAKVTCLRCGIDHILKLDTYNKRLERKQQATICRDCWQHKTDFDVAEFWLFVKNALRLTAN